MIRHPDIPQEVSLDFLAKLEKDDPYTWYAQPKYDGRRRVISVDINRVVTYRAKNRDDREELPEPLRFAVHAMDWSPGTTLDCEWVGPRQTGGAHRLFVFDILERNGEPMYDIPFDERYTHMRHEVESSIALPGDDRVQIAPIRRNPGLCDYYAEQLLNPISEGLVVRRWDSKIIGSTVKCAVNPHVFKVKHKRIKE